MIKLKTKQMTSCFITAEHLMLDVFANIPGITCKPLFGGFSFYRDGVIFACIADGILYFKTDDNNRPQYEALGCKSFVYQHKNTKKITTMPYAELPEIILEDPEQLKVWIDASVAASLGAQKKKNKLT